MQACKNKTAHKISRLPRFSRDRNIPYFNKEFCVTPSAQMQNNNTNMNNTDWALSGQSCQLMGWESSPWWWGRGKQRSSLWHRHGAGLCSPAQQPELWQHIWLYFQGVPWNMANKPRQFHSLLFTQAPASTSVRAKLGVHSSSTSTFCIAKAWTELSLKE